MKSGKFKSVIVFALLSALFVINATAQPRGDFRKQNKPSRQACLMIPDLTEEQESQINALHTEQLKERTQHRAQMDELRAKKRPLMLEDSPDMAEVENIIDKKAELRGEHMKSKANHRQNVREILTEEQRIYYDSRPGLKQGSRYEMREGRADRSIRGRGMQGRGMYRNW